MSSILVRLAEHPDAPAVARLVRALEAHYAGAGTSAPPEPAQAMVERSMADREGTRYALAFAGDRAVGLMCFAVLRPGFDLLGLIYLKELFVEEEARGRAVGQAMMRWLADHARTHGLGRIDLTTDVGNRGAQSFYERLGAQKLDKVVYRFTLEPGARSDDME